MRAADWITQQGRYTYVSDLIYCVVQIDANILLFHLTESLYSSSGNFTCGSITRKLPRPIQMGQISKAVTICEHKGDVSGGCLRNRNSDSFVQCWHRKRDFNWLHQVLAFCNRRVRFSIGREQSLYSETESEWYSWVCRGGPRGIENSHCSRIGDREPVLQSRLRRQNRILCRS